MRDELQKIINELNFNEFIINLEDDIQSFSYLHFIKVNDFDPIFRENHKLFNATDNAEKKKRIQKDDLEVYKELSKYLKKLISGLEGSTIKIHLSFNYKYKPLLENALKDLYKIDNNLDFKQKIKFQTLKKLRQQQKETKEAIFRLKNYSFMTYKNEDYLGSNFYLRFSREEIIYKEISLSNTSFGSSILYRDDRQDEDKITLLNVVAFLQATPNFILTKNSEYNRKLANIYSEFDILDLLTLTGKKFFKTPKSKFKSLSNPILKLYKNTNSTIIPEVKKLEILNLYHSSLKQIEPLPRCVFLFRIVEYAKNHHYQPKFKPDKVELPEIIEYYYKEVLTHKFIPLYFLDHGSEWDEAKQDLVKKRKSQYLNLITELRKKSKQILSKWEKHHYLGSKSLGDIIYKTGRNTVAHGGSNQNINYDYSNKYKHINDVNIFLELISRFLIEIHNPELRKIVHHQKKIYELNCSHLRMEKDGKARPIEI